MLLLVLYPPPSLMLNIAYFAVAEGWLLLDIGWFVLFSKLFFKQLKQFAKWADFPWIRASSFNVGVISGQKEDTENVSEPMKYATNSDGTRLFSSDEFLTPQQILSFFSRHARKYRCL